MKNKLEKKIQEFLKKECKPYYGSLWGQKRFVKPALIAEIQGDGLQIVRLTPLATRPQYYILRIDSKTDLESQDFNIEDLLVPIEEEFDNIDRYEEKPDNPHDEGIKPFRYKFPMLNTKCGCNLDVIKNFGIKSQEEG